MTAGLGWTDTTRSFSSLIDLKPCAVSAGTMTTFPSGTSICSSPAVNRAVPDWTMNSSA